MNRFLVCDLPVWVLVWCISGTWGFALQKIENGSEGPADVDIDYYDNYEAKRFLDAWKKIRPESDNTWDQPHVETTTGKYSGSDVTPLDSWSVVWYIASFGGLIAFFLIVSCSEWCCRRAVRNQQSCGASGGGNAATPNNSAPQTPDSPPPSYDQFAPPSYESICLGRQARGEKNEYDIYVVPVHALGSMLEYSNGSITEASSHVMEDEPPSYVNANSPQTPTDRFNHSHMGGGVGGGGAVLPNVHQFGTSGATAVRLS